MGGKGASKGHQKVMKGTPVKGVAYESRPLPAYGFRLGSQLWLLLRTS
jgi:hypothetical protein